MNAKMIVTAQNAILIDMSYYAQIDENNIVQRVIVADEDFILSGVVGDPNSWVRTSKDQMITKHFAGVGYTFNRDVNDFIAPKPFPSWELNDKNEWSPVGKVALNPDQELWDESKREWVAK